MYQKLVIHDLVLTRSILLRNLFYCTSKTTPIWCHKNQEVEKETDQISTCRERKEKVENFSISQHHRLNISVAHLRSPFSPFSWTSINSTGSLLRPTKKHKIWRISFLERRTDHKNFSVLLCGWFAGWFPPHFISVFFFFPEFPSSRRERETKSDVE